MWATAAIGHKLSEFVQVHTVFRESKVSLKLFTMLPQLKVKCCQLYGVISPPKFNIGI